MATQTQGRVTGEFLISEAGGTRSRENVTLLSGENLSAGAVLGVVTASGKYVEHDPDASNGAENAVAVLYDNVDASAGDTEAVVIARDAEVDSNALEWITGIAGGDQADAITNLATVGIIVR